MKNEIVQAIIDLKQAEQNFKYADNEFIAVSIHQLRAAESKVNVLIYLKVKGKKKADSLRENPLKANWLTKLFTESIPQEEQTVNKKIQVDVVNSTSNSEKHVMAIGKNF